MAATRNLVIKQGKTFSLILRWELDEILYKAITGIEQSAPARLVVPLHNIPDGWRGAVTNVRGMVEINSEANNIGDSDYKEITVIDANTIELNAVNAAGFKAYTSGGYLQINKPADLAGYTARMKIKNKIGGALLASADAADAPLNIISLTIDQVKKTITVLISASSTAAIAWRKGEYELELVSGSGVVHSAMSGQVSVLREIAT